MSTPTELRAGSELLGYRVERVLGRGGMGVVYLARQVALDRLVALKLLAPELAHDHRFRERFLRESRLAAALDHPNIVPVHDAGEADGRLYIAMRYVEGTDLRRLLDDEGPLEPKRALSLLSPVADALDTAHAKGLVHRDVKPSNILLDQQQRPYLADFGLTREVSERGLVEPSHFAASLDYVAPEHIEGEPVGPAADQYALACVLHESLTGEPPFKRDTSLATLWAHVDEPPPESGEPIDAVLAKALAKEPNERYPSCRELITNARAALGVPDIVVLRDRRPLVFAAIGLLLAAAALAAGLTLALGDGGPAKPSTKPTLDPSTDALQRIDPATNKLVATLRVGSDPTGVAVSAGAVWTIHFDDNRISKIDPRTDGVVATSSAPGPKAIAAGADSVWIVNGDGRAVTQLDQRSAAQLHVVPVPSSTELLAFGWGSVWAVSPLTGTVARINPRSSSVSGSTHVPARRGALKAIAAGQGALWVTSSDIVADQYGVFRIDPGSGRVVGRIPLRLGAQGVAAGEGAVWVANPLGDTVSQIEPSTNRVVHTIEVGNDPIAIAAGFGAVWVTNYIDGTVSRIEPTSGRVAATIGVGPNPDRIAVGENGVWVTVHSR